MAESVGSLYIRLGLSLSELETDFITAERTVSENIRRLNREAELIRIRSEVEIAGLDETADAERILQIRTDALNQRMAIQRDRVNLLTAELRSLTEAHGENSAVVQRATIRLERERLALANLERELRGLNDSSEETNDIFGELSDMLPAMPTRLQAIGMAFTALSAGIGAAAMATKGLVEEFRELQNQSYELNMSFPDTREFLREMRLAGGDIGDYEGYIRGITDAYVKGEYDDPEFIALRKYGAEIVDATGRLKSFKDISEEVFQAWEKADAAGEGIEFLQLTGGESGIRDAIQYFQRLREAREDAAKIFKAEMDDKQLHKLERTFNLVDEQAKELKTALGDIFVPAAQEAGKKFFQMLHEGTQFLTENKDAMQEWGFVTAEAIDTVANKWREFTSYQMPNTGDEKVDKMLDRLQWQQSFFNDQALWGDRSPWSTIFSKLPKDLFSGILERAKERQDAYNAGLEDTGKAADKAAEEVENLSDAQKKNGEALNQYGTDRIQQFKNELEDLQVELKFSGDEFKKSLAQLDLWRQRETVQKNFLSPEEAAVINRIYEARKKLLEQEHYNAIDERIQDNLGNAADIEFEMTHTAFEKQIRDIELWEEAQKEKAETAAEVSAIIAESAAKEAQAFEDEMDRIKGKLQSLDDKIFDIDHSQYEKDLRRIQQDYLKEAQEYQEQGIFTPEIKAKLDYLYTRQKQDIDKRASESRTKGGDYTKTPEGSRGGGMPIGLFADTREIEALLYSKLDANAQNEVNKLRGAEDLAPVQQELQKFGETVRQTADDLQSVEDLKDSLKGAADTRKTLDDRIRSLTESTSKLAEAQNDFAGTLKKISPTDSPQTKGGTSEKSTFAQKVKESALAISGLPPKVESEVPKISDSTQRISGKQYYRVPESTDLDRRLREILDISLSENIFHKGKSLAINENERPKIMPDLKTTTDVDLSALETSLASIDEKIQGILQAIGTQEPYEDDRYQELFGTLPNIEEDVKNILLALQSREEESELPESLSSLPRIDENVQSILQTLQSSKENPAAPITASGGETVDYLTPLMRIDGNLQSVLQELQTPKTESTLADYMTPLNSIEGKVQSILQKVEAQQPVTFETIITPLDRIAGLVQNILAALGNRQPPQITIAPNNSIDLGGAYVFDNEMKQSLVNDITKDIVDEITTSVRQAISKSSYGYSA